MQYQRLIELIDQNPEFVEFGEFGSGVSEEWINAAEKRLNLKFPPSYIWWLKNFNGGEIYGEELYSIYGLDFDEVIGGDIVYINEINRKRGSSDENMLLIHNTDLDGAYFFNLLETDEKGEFPVYLNTKDSKYASNYIDFLIRKITE